MSLKVNAFTLEWWLDVHESYTHDVQYFYEWGNAESYKIALEKVSWIKNRIINKYEKPMTLILQRIIQAAKKLKTDGMKTFVVVKQRDKGFPNFGDVWVVQPSQKYFEYINEKGEGDSVLFDSEYFELV